MSGAEIVQAWGEAWRAELDRVGVRAVDPPYADLAERIDEHTAELRALLREAVDAIVNIDRCHYEADDLNGSSEFILALTAATSALARFRAALGEEQA